MATMLIVLLACGPASQLPNITAAPPPAAAETTTADLPVGQPPAAIEDPAPVDAAAPAPQEGDGDEGDEDDTEEEEEKPTPTPTPNIVGCALMPEPYQSQKELADDQVMKDGLKYQCFPTPEPTPTPKYADLGDDLSRLAIQGEEALKEKEQARGASADAIDIPIVKLGAAFKDVASTNAAVTWLAEKRIPKLAYGAGPSESDLGGIFWTEEKILWIEMPAHMLPALQAREGLEGFIYPLPDDFPNR